MNKAMESAPDVIYWQGQDLYLDSIKTFEGKAQSQNLEGVIRFSFADKKGIVRLMQWQFPNNPPIDWQRLENENREAPPEPVLPTARVYTRVLLQSPQAVYNRLAQRRWRAKQKAERQQRKED